MQSKIKFEYKITGIYLIVGFCWIIFSDMLIEYSFPDELITRFQTYKGSFYITVTAILLYFLVKQHDRKIKRANQLIINKNIELTKSEEELNKSNEELIQAKEKAEESDRLKTAFLQNMSHEIRTPLNAISGFAGILNKPEVTEEKRQSFIQIIQNSSTQLHSIVSDILTISALETKQEKLKINKVCINTVITNLLTLFKQQLTNQNISIYAKLELDDKQSLVYTDETKLNQILTNLISNAIKFTHKGFVEFGYKILVETMHASSQPKLQFYVKDSGIGIKPELHGKIFERFRQADYSINRNYGGTGLGLAISKSFVELMGGNIWVESEPNVGSTFYFTIPYNHVNEYEPKTTSTPTKLNENLKTILVAEDQDYNFLFIKVLLMSMKCNVIHAKNGMDAVDICKSATPIDLILMDIKMPILDGHSAAKLIKIERPNVPIIAQSAYALDHEIEKYKDVFDSYITKPINAEMLIEVILQYMNKS